MLSASLLLFFLLSKTCASSFIKQTQKATFYRSPSYIAKFLRAIVFNRIQLHAPVEAQQAHLLSSLLTKQRLAAISFPKLQMT